MESVFGMSAQVLIRRDGTNEVYEEVSQNGYHSSGRKFAVILDCFRPADSRLAANWVTSVAGLFAVPSASTLVGSLLLGCCDIGCAWVSPFRRHGRQPLHVPFGVIIDIELHDLGCMRWFPDLRG